MWGTARRLEKYCNKVRVQINHITYKTKESCKHLIYSSLILIYCIFSDLYFTSSKINYIEYQYITYHMVQISNIISILKTWNQESLRAFHAI